MSDTEKDAEAKAAETELPTCDTDASEEGAKEDELISLETLRESPVQWPEKFPGLEEFLTASDTPLHTPNQKFPNSENMTTMQEFASMPPEQLLAKIQSMHDQIYSLGRRESKEMTRGKLLGIFNRNYLSPKK